MPSQFFGLSIASSGLRAANAAQNTVANNIANVQTKGYSRQKVTQEASDALRVFATYGCAGAGVDTVAIERIRDSFYDMRYRNNNSTLGEYDIKNYYAETVEQYLEDDGAGFSSIFNKFAAALESITTNSSSTESKAQFISAAESMATYFNNTAANLRDLQEDINAQIKIRVDRINSLASEIATLNKQINVVEMSTHGRANELRDKRDLMVDELSSIVDVEVRETAVTDTNNPERETGGTRFTVYIAGGQVLVDGIDYSSLECRSRATWEKTHMTDVDGLYDIYWDNGNEFNLNNASMEGELKGLVAMRDGDNNQSFQGTVTDVARSADGKDAVVTIRVGLDYLQDMNKCNLSETGGKITIGNTVYYYKSWEYDKDSSTYKFRMDDERCDSIITAAKVTKDAQIGFDVSYQGIPYYLEQMNEFARTFSAKVNEIFMSGYGRDNITKTMLFTARKPVIGNNLRNNQYSYSDFSDANGYYEMTAFNLAVNSDLIADANLLGTRKSEDASNEEECEKVKELLTALKDNSKFTFRNATAGEFLECLLSDVALNKGNAKSFYDTYKGISVTIDNQRTSISGVDEDEEAVSLVQHQYSYTLASKMIQTLTEMYDQLILSTGV